MKLHTVITLQLHCNCDTLHALLIDITLYTVITLKLRYIAGARQVKTLCEFYLRRETHYVSVRIESMIAVDVAASRATGDSAAANPAAGAAPLSAADVGGIAQDFLDALPPELRAEASLGMRFGDFVTLGCEVSRNHTGTCEAVPIAGGAKLTLPLS